jgi:hypothetical protein
VNTIRVRQDHDDLQLEIDGEVIEDLFDPIEFVLPLRIGKSSTLFFFTCTCRIPGCAGWHEGFNVRVDDGIKWECFDEDKFDVVDQHYHFDVKEYLDAQQACKDILYDIAMKRECSPPTVEDDDGYDYRVLNFNNAQELTDEINHRIEWMRKYTNGT